MQSGSSKSAPPILQFVFTHSPSVLPQKSGGTHPHSLSTLQSTKVYIPAISHGAPVNTTEVSSQIFPSSQSELWSVYVKVTGSQ